MCLQFMLAAMILSQPKNDLVRLAGFALID